MPHFIIHCSEHVVELISPKEIIQEVYDAAEATTLYDKGDIKVRITPFTEFNVGNKKKDFIHVFGHIMEGRTSSQKSMLSKSIVTALNKMFPEVSFISINISDFEAATYCNKSML